MFLILPPTCRQNEDEKSWGVIMGACLYPVVPLCF